MSAIVDKTKSFDRPPVMKKMPSFKLSPFSQTPDREELQKAFAGPEIKPTDIEIKGKELGHGATGVVYQAKVCGQMVAVKEILPKLMDNAKSIEGFKQEVQLMSQVSRHPNVVLFLGACIDEQKGYCLVTELCKKSLEKLLGEPEEYNKLTTFDKLMIGYDILKGLAWLHEMGIAHCDLKPDNLLMDANNAWKVADFGYSRLFNDPHKLGITASSLLPKGAPLYMGPERLKHISDSNYSAPFQLASDVYSFAILLWEVLVGIPPYKHCKNVAALKEAVVNHKERPSFDFLVEACGDFIEKTSLWSILSDMWQQEPKDRPSFSDILPRYDALLLEVSIADMKGRYFWEKNFCKPSTAFQRKIEWADFVAAMENELGADIKDLYDEDDKESVADSMHKVLCMKWTLCGEGEEVDIEKFGRVCDTLGPWELHFKNKELIGMPKKLEKLTTFKWFRPNVGKGKASEILQTKSHGTFLVRLSSNRKTLVLSKKADSADLVAHTYILKTESGFSLKPEGPFAKTLEEFVELAQKTGVVMFPIDNEDSVIPTKEQLVKGGETTSRYDEKLFELKGVGSVKERLKFLQKRRDELKEKVDEGDVSVFVALGQVTYEIGVVESQLKQL